MKRTILLIAALVIGATSANAQRFISKDAPKAANRAVAAKERGTDLNVKKESQNLRKDFVYGDPVMTVDFSTTDVNYSFDNLPGHTAGDLQGKFQRYDTSAATTSILAASYSEWVYYYYNAFGNYSWYSDRAGAKIGDGFALLSPIDLFYADGEVNTKTYNTAIKCTEPFVTTGFNTVDVKFNQICRRFNDDRYFIDYSTDPTFSTYDSLEFNIKGIELAVNSYGKWTNRVTLPVAKSVDKPALYIRLRYTCSPRVGAFAQSQPSSYFWLVDEINVYDGPAQRVDEIATAHTYAAYGVIPQGMKMDTLVCRTIIENTGGDTLFNAILEERYHLADAYNFSPITFNTDLNYTSVTATPVNISTDVRVDTIRDQSQSITSLDIRRYIAIYSFSARLNKDVVGVHGLSTSVKYNPTSSSTDIVSTVVGDSLYYNVVPMPDENATTSAVWARDMNVLVERGAWTKGMVGENVFSDYTTAAFEPGYTVCNRFMTPSDLEEDMYYAKGVEVVPAADSCTAGVRIQASLRYEVPGATTYEELIADVLDVNNQPIVSDPHLVSAEELNNGVFSEGANISTEFTSINLPFNTPAIKLEPGTSYYACFKIIDNNGGNSKFLVASDNKSLVETFRDYDGWENIVATPGQEANEDATWGSFFGSLDDGNAPMVRLKVSKNPLSISGVTPSTPSFNLNAYPNPAQNETTIEYALTSNANVYITVTDIMGREVVRLNEGNKAANTVNRVSLDTKNLNNGTYFYTINVNGVKETKKLVINK